MIVSVAWQAILEAGSTGDGPGWDCAVVRAKFRKLYAIASDYSMPLFQSAPINVLITITAKHDHSNCA